LTATAEDKDSCSKAGDATKQWVLPGNTYSLKNVNIAICQCRSEGHEIWSLELSITINCNDKLRVMGESE